MKSDIWNKPPLYIKVWQYLLMKATHQDYKGLKRGQCFTTIKEIQEECSYIQGFVEKKPSYKQIRDILDYLKNDHEVTDEGQYEGQYEGQKNNSMIVITKVTHGMIVTIVNYNVYQDPSLYESQYEGRKNEDTKVNMKELRRNFEGHNINKNNKKEPL